MYVSARAKDWTEERLAGFKAAQLVVPQIQQNTTVQQNASNTTKHNKIQKIQLYKVPQIQQCDLDEKVSISRIS